MSLFKPVNAKISGTTPTCLFVSFNSLWPLAEHTYMSQFKTYTPYFVSTFMLYISPVRIHIHYCSTLDQRDIWEEGWLGGIETIAKLPPFGPIEGQKWFDQISSQ
jgi:hypothetical protein